MDAARRGENALEAKNAAEAITHFSEAITQSPNAASYYIKRSTAYQRCKQYAEALADAEIAVTLSFKRAKRELIAQAQLRRGIALFNLERYGDAKQCLEWAQEYDAKDKLASVWQSQVNGKLKNLSGGDAKTLATVEENPKIEPTTQNLTSTNPQSIPIRGSNGAETSKEVADGAATTAAVPAQPIQTAPSKIRHEWYQNSDNVYVTLLAKGVPREQASVTIGERSLSISFPLATGSDFDLSLDPLFGAVNVEASTHKILSTKIEVTLKKVSAGLKWPSLEISPQDQALYDVEAASAPRFVTSAEPANNKNVAAKATAPSYPTSSRSGPKDWDKIASSYTKPSESKSEKSEDPQASAAKDKPDEIYIDEFDEGGDEVNAFFKKLYAGASDETKRAMMKSYQESGGTALSTNWEEVKKAPVPVSPPDGMEEKKWEY